MCVLDISGKNSDRLCIVYCLCMATCYMFVPQHSVTCTLPVLVCWSLTVRTAADNSKIKLQAVVPFAVRTVVTMKGWNMCSFLTEGIAVDICTHMALCWNTTGLFPICVVYCRKYSVWHINFMNTILYYKHKAVLDSKIPALFIFSNTSPPTSH